MPEEDGDDQMRIMSGRASLSEFSKASLSKREQDEPKGDYELNEEDQGKLDEDSRYLLHDKLDGAAPIGKPKRLHEGEEMMADQEIYNWYSAVTGVALSRNMKLAMAPEKPNKISDVPPHLGQWSALVETLQKYASAYSRPSPCRGTALRAINSHAGDWFDDWQQDCFKTWRP